MHADHRCISDARESVARAPAAGVGAALKMYFALLVVCMIGWGVAIANEGAMSGEEVLALEIWLTVGFAVVSLSGAVAWRKDIVPLLARPTGKWLLMGALGGVASFLLAEVSQRLLVFVFKIPLISTAEDGPVTAGGFFLALALVAVCPAIFEEISFRGIIMSGLAQTLRPREVVIVSAAMFTILHFQFLGVLHLMAIGVFAAVLRLRSASLLPCMVLHLTHNGLIVFADHFLGI